RPCRRRSCFAPRGADLTFAPVTAGELMRNLVCAVATCTVILATLGGAVAADVIAERQEAMKTTGDAIKAIKAAVDGDKPADAVAPAETIAAVMKKVPGLFPQGSGEGKTDAKPEIWADWAKFEESAAGTAIAAEKLALVAKSGDTGATADALKALGGACGTCHKPFRKPKT